MHLPTPIDSVRLARIIARIVERLRPEAIWLFGSRAEGRARPDSDYDLLVVVPDGAPEADLNPVDAYEITRGLGLPVDLIPCPRSVFEEEKTELNTLARAAFMRGRLLYEQAA